MCSFSTYSAPLGTLADESFGKMRVGEKVQMDIAAENGSDAIPVCQIAINPANRFRHGVHGGIAKLVSSRAFAGRQPGVCFAAFYFDVAELR